MHGHILPEGYIGLVGNRWILFPTEQEYYEFLKTAEDECTYSHKPILNMKKESI